MDVNLYKPEIKTSKVSWYGIVDDPFTSAKLQIVNDKVLFVIEHEYYKTFTYSIEDKTSLRNLSIFLLQNNKIQTFITNQEIKDKVTKAKPYIDMFDNFSFTVYCKRINESNMSNFNKINELINTPLIQFEFEDIDNYSYIKITLFEYTCYFIIDKIKIEFILELFERFTKEKIGG